MKAGIAVRWTVVLVVVAALGLGACGGGDADGDGAGGGSGGSSGSSTMAAASSGADGGTGGSAKEKEKEKGPEVPAFLGDLDRVCTTQVGFPGVAAYEAGAPGPHPVAFFDDFRGEGFVESARQLPQGWGVEQDANYEDTSDLEKTQLVACADRVEEIPTGVSCDFENDGEKTVLELVDSVYDLKVYAATNGALVHQQRLEAHSTTCPYIATFKKGDKTFVTQPSDDDYIGALKSVVAPS